jgi:hypothetical protein
MTDEHLPAHPIGPHERERAVKRLCMHFARDHLGVDEFEHRLDLAYAAREHAELLALESDLPALIDPSPPPATPEPEMLGAAVVVDPTRPVSERDFLVAVMGGVERKGMWTPPKQMTVLAIMGGAELDFRDAEFGSPVTQVTVISLMGGVDIIVPPGVRVESNGVAIMGGFGAEEPSRPPNPDAPVIKVNGFALMAGVDIKERLSGESDRQARKRLKAERKARARLQAPDPDTKS